jgi:hypothetical protein
MKTLMPIRTGGEFAEGLRIRVNRCSSVVEKDREDGDGRSVYVFRAGRRGGLPLRRTFVSPPTVKMIETFIV